MNLKSLAIKNHSTDNEPKTAYIECEGKGVVTAADIQADQDIEIMNPDQVIATLNGGKDCRLAMELTITKGADISVLIKVNLMICRSVYLQLMLSIHR